MCRLALLGGPLLAIVLTGCGPLTYYAQLAHGEAALLAARQPIAKLVVDPHTPQRLKQRLRLAQRARAFASDHLDLPRNASYTTFANLHRRYAVWNVYATPALSVAPVRHCFPIAGCVAYRGYFDRAGAEAEAARLRVRGDDVIVAGVPTFSTLGWFDDPVLSTMLRWDDDELAGEIFHELAHQKLYVAGDTQFNESYANFVERQGLRQWRQARGAPPGGGVATARADDIAKLMLDTRARLAKLYRLPLPADMLRARKADEFAALRPRYRMLRDGAWHGYAGYDAFFSKPLNNASLLPFGLYDRWVPGFARLYAEGGASWPAFFRAVHRLADEPQAERDAAMARLTAAATT